MRPIPRQPYYVDIDVAARDLQVGDAVVGFGMITVGPRPHGEGYVRVEVAGFGATFFHDETVLTVSRSNPHAGGIVPTAVEEAAAAVDKLDGQVWWDIGPALTCDEAETLAALLDASGAAEAADALREGHAQGDHPGDDHYIG